MKQLTRWLLGVGVVLGARLPDVAQTQPGEQAQVYTVTNDGAGGNFHLPQVRLANTAVARRINRQLLGLVTDYSSAIDSTASPRRQLTQLARECCYDEESRSWLAAGSGLTGMTYEVLLNQNYLLSFQFQREDQGLAQPGTSHLTFDLRTGRLLTLAELVADAPAQLERRLGYAISRRLHDELANVVANYGDDSTMIAHVAQLYGISEWNTTPQAALRLDMGNGSGGDPYESRLHLTEFALRPNALLLFYSVGMSRLNFEFLPDETYVFPYTRLQPRPLLQPIAQASASKKK
ncbi:hypothetical protein [Hymenobacter cellulosilyticus]|uniref:Uncharacterized protein n=1 Tax=Hymenobacter cellulosilyticus TaxID=2932248 RepID=A0A8T9Q0Y6_9BACT|nr:hypothetical protein [Hymenobacter cellulosilyticus]UOQ71114.1 hypothetical protein MUN79_20950 [Hymenobacter cellulosilyticus]